MTIPAPLYFRALSEMAVYLGVPDGCAENLSSIYRPNKSTKLGRFEDNNTPAKKLLSRQCLLEFGAQKLLYLVQGRGHNFSNDGKRFKTLGTSEAPFGHNQIERPYALT